MEKTDFTPVFPHFYDIFEQAQHKDTSRILYFSEGIEIQEERGKIIQLNKNGLNEEFLQFDTGAQVRVDRIISINGKPGPAFDEYDRFGMACLDCNFETS